jgi:ABC-2 type transport system permease protein
MAPFFVFVYYLITETSKTHYNFSILNMDRGVENQSVMVNYGDTLVEKAKTFLKNTPKSPLTLQSEENKTEAIMKLKNRKADALIIIPPDFSQDIRNWLEGKEEKSIQVEFIGDLTDIKYMVSAIWANEIITDYIFKATGKMRPVSIIETGLGVSGKIDDFSLSIPGLMILSVIMLMFSATIAIVNEVENKTILRLKLSRLSAIEYLSGIGAIQVLIGVISVLFTYITAVALGFDSRGSIFLFLILAVLTGISMVAFSLVIAAMTKTANEVLIVGNFPLFLFMFFTGAAFPIEGKTLFTIAGYSFTLQGLMSPTHAISALKKVMILDMGIMDILPEIIVLFIITVVYFIIGVWAFQRRHMKTV